MKRNQKKSNRLLAILWKRYRKLIISIVFWIAKLLFFDELFD